MGLSLNMGLEGQGALGSGYGPAATPAAAGASPQGPTTIGQKAFGIVTGGSGSSVAHIGLISVGGACIAALCFIYWSLPR
jgi:type IV secretory pathway VirB2 component (pilin)